MSEQRRDTSSDERPADAGPAEELPFDLATLRRQSGLRLDRDGRWWFRGESMENQRVVDLFDRGLRVAPSGDVELHVGAEWCYVDVDETAYVVRRARDEDDSVALVLNDGTEERLDPSTLMAFGDRDLYCRVKDGRCPARFLRDAYHHVALRLEVDGRGNYAVRTEDGRLPVAVLHAPPGPVWESEPRARGGEGS